MNKVYQTIIDPQHGNCMQAAIASLLELDIEDVPNFIESERDSHSDLYNFLLNRNIYTTNIHRNSRRTTEFMKKIAKFDGGINGFFYAIVPSQTFQDVFHAVIIDTDLNIVHDPNPNGRALKLTPDDVESFLSTREFIIGKTGKFFTQEEWDNASEEEKNLNTYKQGE